jgi:cytochrome c oxidase subunit 3/cytochrome o ubiquinol oxidase subunit 3
VTAALPSGTTAQAEHTHTSTGLDNAKLGMWAFLGSEFLFFGGFISTFLLYKSDTAHGETPKDVLNIPFTSVTSFILLASSLSMVLALASAGRNDIRRMRVWLLATAFMGMVFVGGQIYEFTEFIREGVNPGSNSASSAFFVLTGVHGAHVTVGIVMLLMLVGASFKWDLGGSWGSRAVEHVGLYWHFVDLIWVLIFTIVYLID